jgi:hypothetical protein
MEEIQDSQEVSQIVQVDGETFERLEETLSDLNEYLKVKNDKEENNQELLVELNDNMILLVQETRELQGLIVQNTTAENVESSALADYANASIIFVVLGILPVLVLYRLYKTGFGLLRYLV